MDIFNYLNKIRKQEIKNKYNLTEKRYNQLLKNIRARLNVVKKLYGYTEYEIPNTRQLLDYSLKKRRNYIGRYDVFLNTPTKVSNKSKINALRIYSGIEGDFNKGFYTFSSGILQFQIMYENSNNILNGKNNIIEVPLFKVGENFSSEKGYYFKNNSYGRKIVNSLNKIIKKYNFDIKKATKNNALELYIITVKKIMKIINFSTTHDAISGS